MKNGEYNKFEVELNWEYKFFEDINYKEDKGLIKKLL